MMEEDAWQSQPSKPVWIVGQRSHTGAASEWGRSSYDGSTGSSALETNDSVSTGLMVSSSSFDAKLRYDLPDYESEPDSEGGASSCEIVEALVCKYAEKTVEEFLTEDLESFLPELKTAKDRPWFYWIRISGRSENRAAVSLFQKHFNMHDVAGDVVTKPPQRPKMIVHDSMLFFLTHAPKRIRDSPDRGTTYQAHQVCLLAVPDSNFCVTFHDDGEDSENSHWVGQCMERIHGNIDGIRSQTTSSLLVVILKCIIDSFFPAVEYYGDQLEHLEDWLMSGKTNKNISKAISRLKRDMSRLRRVIWPMREYIADMMIMTDLFTEDSSRNTQELYENLTYLADMIETQRDISGGLVDLYLSSQDHNTQLVMQHLTVIGSIFIPFSFLAGVYGMNFEHIPEYQIKSGYFVFWIFVIITGVYVTFRLRRVWR